MKGSESYDACLQERFVAAIVGEGEAGSHPSLLEGFLPTGRLASVTDALEIYQTAYQLNLGDALADTYQATRVLLGYERFFKLARAYALEHPSTSYSLSHYGAAWPDFLRQSPLAATIVTPPLIAVLPDLAGFEWQFMQVFHLASPSAGPLPLESLSGESKFSLWPSVRLCASRYAVYPLWQFCQNHGDLASESCIRDEEQLRGMMSGPEYLALYKNLDDKVWVLSLSDWEFEVLSRLHAGRSLGGALCDLDQAVYTLGGLKEAPSEPSLRGFFAKLAQLPLLRVETAKGEASLL